MAELERVQDLRDYTPPSGSPTWSARSQDTEVFTEDSEDSDDAEKAVTHDLIAQEAKAARMGQSGASKQLNVEKLEATIDKFVLQQKADAGHFESMVLYLEKTQQERNLDANHLNQIVDKRQAQEPPASVLPPFAEEQVEDALESLSCPNSEAPHIDRELAAARGRAAIARLTHMNQALEDSLNEATLRTEKCASSHSSTNSGNSIDIDSTTMPCDLSTGPQSTQTAAQ